MLHDGYDIHGRGGAGDDNYRQVGINSADPLLALNLAPRLAVTRQRVFCVLEFQLNPLQLQLKVRQD